MNADLIKMYLLTLWLLPYTIFAQVNGNDPVDRPVNGDAGTWSGWAWFWLIVLIIAVALIIWYAFGAGGKGSGKVQRHGNNAPGTHPTT